MNPIIGQPLLCQSDNLITAEVTFDIMNSSDDTGESGGAPLVLVLIVSPGKQQN